MKKISQVPSSIEHPFAPYIRILGKGKTGTRSLEMDEARQAFGMILRGEAEPVQVGAFLMLLRVKEESAEELAGFVQACREEMIATPDDLASDIDWSCYAGKKHQHPWFILSMLLLAGAGHRIFVHGSAGHTVGRLYTEDAMRQLRLPVASNWNEVRQQLNGPHLSYLPLKRFCPNLDALMQLRPLLGLRSPVNTLSRLLNPLHAVASIQSVFHPPYARLHQEADQLLKQPRAIVFKGESGEAEIKPQAQSTVYLLEDGRSHQLLFPRSISQRAHSVEFPSVEPLRDLWSGTATYDYGLAATLATTTAGLLAVSPGLDLESAQHQALLLWQNRNRSRLC
jgi:anthranilate phosphoribosyltransferase